jgi:predicted AAA+ superfamily ATPase
LQALPQAILVPAMLGLYPENLVFTVLRKWPVLQIDYYRETSYEVDFIVHTGPNCYWPVEVKYRDRMQVQDLRGVGKFCAKYRCHEPTIVTNNRTDFGEMRLDKLTVFRIPLLQFLVMLG